MQTVLIFLIYRDITNSIGMTAASFQVSGLGVFSPVKYCTQYGSCNWHYYLIMFMKSCYQLPKHIGLFTGQESDVRHKWGCDRIRHPCIFQIFNGSSVLSICPVQLSYF